MRFDTIVCLDDLLRDGFWPAKAFIYDLVRTPIFAASGLHIGKSPRHGQASNLKPGFDTARLLSHMGPQGSATPWAQAYHAWPGEAVAYLSRHLPKRALVIGYEMTPALRAALDAADCAWLDIRLAPLRFGQDLYMALRTNRRELYDAVHAHALQPMDVMADAALLAARLRYRRRYGPRDTALDGACVYVGQTETDASLLDASGSFVRVDQHATTLRALAGAGALLYKPHPYAGDFSQRELAALERIAGRKVPHCTLDTYELLAAEEEVTLVGISSGTLQEAAWFGRRSFSLIPPLCPPRFDAAFDTEGYQLVASHVFMSSPLWRDLVGTTDHTDAHAPLQLAPQANRLRELHNTWWGYGTAMLRDNLFQREAFDLAGGRAQAEALARTEAELARTRDELAQLKQEFARWRESMQGAAEMPLATSAHHLPRRALPRQNAA